MKKSQQHPKDFPGGLPHQYYPGLETSNFRVRIGSGAFHAEWPLTNCELRRSRGIQWCPTFRGNIMINGRDVVGVVMKKRQQKQHTSLWQIVV